MICYLLDCPGLSHVLPLTSTRGPASSDIGAIFLGFCELLVTKSDELLRETLVHLQMTLIAVAASTLIGLTIALLVWDKPRSRVLAQGVCNAFMTIPSLALLVFLLPFFGLGMTPTIIALILYSLVPIVKNGITALSDTSPELLDAGNAMGMNRWQVLYFIQVPQGLPLLVAGLRVAFVFAIGTATLGAFVAAGGLGTFIITGLTRQNYSLILLGAIPAAALAVLIDFLLGFIEKAAVRWKNGFPIFQTLWDHISAGLLVALISITGVLGSALYIDSGQDSAKPTITVGCKNFPEQEILGEIIALSLQGTGEFNVERKFGIASSLQTHQSTMGGQIDTYVEYSGTAIQNTLKINEGDTPEETQRMLERLYPERFGLEWLKPLGFSNSYAIIVAAEGPGGDLDTISEYVPLASELICGMPIEFVDRPDGYGALKRTYGLEFESIRSVDIGILYPALEQGEVQAVVAFSTDGQLADGTYIMLEDDQRAFPIYDACPVLRQETARRYPLVRDVLLALQGKFNLSVIRRLNGQVQIFGRNPEDVAAEFYEEHLRALMQELGRDHRADLAGEAKE